MYQWVVFAVSELEGPLFRWFASSEGNDPGRTTARRSGRGDAVGARHARLARRRTAERRRCDVRQRASGAPAPELLAPWPELEAYVQRGEARPAYARAAAISDRPRSSRGPRIQFRTSAGLERHLSIGSAWSEAVAVGPPFLLVAEILDCDDRARTELRFGRQSSRQRSRCRNGQRQDRLAGAVDRECRGDDRGEYRDCPPPVWLCQPGR